MSSPRDWSAHPAIVDRPRPTTTAASAASAATPSLSLYAMSDVHGGYDRMLTLLVANKLIDASPATPADAKWAAGASVFVIAGDLIDKGPSPLEVIDLLRSLEPQATMAGGAVIFTLGNHEAEFLYDPENDKASKDSGGVDEEIRARGLTPVGIASGADVRGQWLRDRPFGARVWGDWFFAHAGNTKGRSLRDLEQALRSAVEAHDDYSDAEIIGDDSILESRGWYESDPLTARRFAEALGARHIVFGHQPDALGSRGEIAVAFDGALFRIDCGLSPNVDDSQGKLLRVYRDGDKDVVESLSPNGTAREIWRER